LFLDKSLPTELLKQVAEQGLNFIPELIHIFVNTAIQMERQKYLGVGPYERSANRQLGTVIYLYLDALYEKVRVDGQVREAVVLMASCVKPDGKRLILGVSVSLGEQELHWRDFMQSLVERGLNGVELIISDAHVGLRKAVFSGISWQLVTVVVSRLSTSSRMLASMCLATG
jgi:transposase-like protein